MAQPSHVPKFGNWDSDNIPYTTYFENARKGKGSGTKNFNPNDPEVNPDAFTPETFTQRRELRNPEYVDNSYNCGTSDADCAPAFKKHHSREDNGFHRYMEAPAPQNSAINRVNVDPQRNRTRNSRNSESGSDKSVSVKSLLPSHRHHRSSKYSVESSYGFSPSPQHAILRTVNTRQSETHHRHASVPKFGAWDETDPTSGEGFTVIFNKVKEEKQFASTKMPTVPTEPTIYPDRQRNGRRASSRSKVCCCLFPTASE